jgi:hypothetical protein
MEYKIIEVHISHDTGKFWKNFHLLCVTKDIEKAVQMVKTAYPGCKIHQVLNRGAWSDGKVLIDQDFLKEATYKIVS